MYVGTFGRQEVSSSTIYHPCVACTLYFTLTLMDLTKNDEPLQTYLDFILCTVLLTIPSPTMVGFLNGTVHIRMWKIIT